MVKALLGRFKIIYVNDRSEQEYWMKEIRELRKGSYRIPTLKQEEVKMDKPKAKIHLVPLIDRTKNIPIGNRDFINKQQTLETLLGKR